MATVNKALGSGGALPANLRAVEVMARNFDFSTANGANGDIRHLILIPAGTLVKKVWLRVMTAEGATAIADVGDYLVSDGSVVDADGWLNDASLNAVALVSGSTEAYAAAGGKLYTADSYLSLTLGTATTYNVAKGTLYAEVVNMTTPSDVA